MTKITRKDIQELLEGVRDVEKGMGWQLWRVGAYSLDGVITLFTAFHGQGLASPVHNREYNDIVEITDILLDKDYTDDDRADLILERIVELKK